MFETYCTRSDYSWILHEVIHQYENKLWTGTVLVHRLQKLFEILSTHDQKMLTKGKLILKSVLQCWATNKIMQKQLI